jgi:MFS family permease
MVTGEEKQSISRPAWRTLIILSCLGLIVMCDETMILPAIPDFIRDFGISYSTSSWLLSAYIIAAAVMTPIAGKLSDIYGKKKILLIVMAVYVVGVLGGRFATNIEFMLAARAAQGVGMAMFPIAFGIIRDLSGEKACNRPDDIQLHIFRRGRYRSGGWRGHNPKLWVAGNVPGDTSCRSGTLADNREVRARPKSSSDAGWNRGRQWQSAK